MSGRPGLQLLNLLTTVDEYEPRPTPTTLPSPYLTTKTPAAELSLCFQITLLRITVPISVVDPSRLCLHPDPDPDPGSHIHSDPDPDVAPELNRIRINSDLDRDLT